MAMDEHLPHEIKLCEMEFNSNHMRKERKNERTRTDSRIS